MDEREHEPHGTIPEGELSPRISFWDKNNCEIGTLWCDEGGTLQFSGNVEKSAKLFLEFLNQQGPWTSREGY